MMIGSELQAQQVPLFNQYYRAPTLAFPSASVFNSRPQLSLVYREQFSGLEGAPTGVALAYSSNIGDKMGWGANVSSTEVGLIRQLRVQGSYGYKLLNSGGHQLAVGALLGFSSFSINDDAVSPESFGDPVLQNLLGNNGSALSVDLSLSYRYKDFKLDFAAPTVVNESLSDDEYVQINEDNIPDYIAGVQYSFLLNAEKQVFFTPNFTWRYREVIGSEVDILGRIDFNNKFSAFGGYRGNYGATFGAGVFINKSLEFTYNYDFGDPQIPFLSDGFSEFGLHLTMKTAEERNGTKYTEGEAVYNRVIDDNIYDPSLLNPKDVDALKNYLYSLEVDGNKKERRANADQRYDELFERLKAQEVARLEAAAQAKRQAKQDSINAVNAERERIERERLAEEARVAEAKRLEAERMAKEAEVKAVAENKYEAATNAAIAEMSTAEQARVRAINQLVTPDRLTELGVLGNADLPASMEYAYIIVVASYNLDSKYSRLFLNTIVDEYDDARIFASRKRKLDYVYIGVSNDYDAVIERMRTIRQDTRFKDSWVHIVRLSELNEN